MRTGEGARSAAVSHEIEFGAFTASEELAQDAACSANSRELIGVAEDGVSNAYRSGAGTLELRLRMCSLFFRLRLLLLTLCELVGSNVLSIAVCTSCNRVSASSGSSWEFGFVLPVLLALRGMRRCRPDLIGGTGI